MGGDLERLIVVGGSAGAVPVLQRVIETLPGDFPAAVLAVIHLSPTEPSGLAAALARITGRDVRFARNGQTLAPGTILLAPPNFHLLVKDGAVALSRGPKENLARPAIDPLFRTAAVSWGARTIGVVLSGRLDDGTAGLRAIKRAGGLAVVQDPAEAEAADMPQSALGFCDVDHVTESTQMASLLDRLVKQPPPRANQPPPGQVLESAMESGLSSMEGEDRIGERSVLTCPECGGTLWRIPDGDMLRYRCHTGHALTADSMSEAYGSAVEKALWSAVRTHRERVGLARDMVAKALMRGHRQSAELWQRRAEECDREADVILSLLLSGEVEKLD
ncbi:MAG: chemotaxis protein CheB [Magnetospirillum sp.]|nr:chemotaxis protein CheB [Magnetospirillum sp.]